MIVFFVIYIYFFCDNVFCDDGFCDYVFGDNVFVIIMFFVFCDNINISVIVRVDLLKCGGFGWCDIYLYECYKN